jgi:hypothetical protein
MRYACPKCGCTDLRVECSIVCILRQPGGDVPAYAEIISLEDAHLDDEESLTLCTNEECEHQAPLSAFEVTEHASAPGSR